MTLDLVFVTLTLAGIIFLLLFLLDRERTRHREIQSEDRRSILALVDKEAVLVADNHLPRPSGKVTYMDEAKEAELNAHTEA